MRRQTWIQVTSKFNRAEIPPSIVIFGRVSAEEIAAFFLRRLYFFAGNSSVCLSLIPSILKSMNSTVHTCTWGTPPHVSFFIASRKKLPKLSPKMCGKQEIKGTEIPGLRTLFLTWLPYSIIFFAFPSNETVSWGASLRGEWQFNRMDPVFQQLSTDAKKRLRYSS